MGPHSKGRVRAVAVVRCVHVPAAPRAAAQARPGSRRPGQHLPRAPNFGEDRIAVGEGGKARAARAPRAAAAAAVGGGGHEAAGGGADLRHRDPVRHRLVRGKELARKVPWGSKHKKQHGGGSGPLRVAGSLNEAHCSVKCPTTPRGQAYPHVPGRLSGGLRRHREPKHEHRTPRL